MLTALAAARFVHFAAVTLLFGLLAFPIYAATPGEAGRTPMRAVRALAILALVTTVVVLACSAANMTGQAATLVDPATLWDVVSGTGLGRVWGLRILLGAAVAALAVRAKTPSPILRAGAGLLLISIALAGHSRMQEGALGWAHLFADCLHLMAAGAWLGGLLALLLLVPRLIRLGREASAAEVLHGFSRMGYIAVAVIVATGVFKTWLLVGSPAGLAGNAYGWTLDVKLVLFAGMGLMALANRFWITPALDARPAEPGPWLKRLKRQVALELALGVGVLAAVGLLGALTPPVSL